jgi:hypothetical protein
VRQSRDAASYHACVKECLVPGFAEGEYDARVLGTGAVALLRGLRPGTDAFGAARPLGPFGDGGAGFPRRIVDERSSETQVGDSGGASGASSRKGVSGRYPATMRARSECRGSSGSCRGSAATVRLEVLR